MNDAVMQDMSKSMDILKIAEPIIIDLLNGGKMLPVEGSDDEICKFLDTSCGCDYFHVYDKTNLTWGVASRFQKCYVRTYDTFTVRLERASGAMTEYEKRKYAIKHNGVYPFLTMQGYYNPDTNEIMSLAIAKTEDVLECIEKGIYQKQHTGSMQKGQASFLCIAWDDMISNGYNVRIYRKSA